MHTMPSRNERLWETLEAFSKKGKWSFQTTLYPSEIARIEKQWDVSVQRLKEENKKVACVITWANAFDEGISYRQSWYISRLTDEIPQVKTPAQRLFLMAARA